MPIQQGYRIPAKQKSCKFGNHWMEDLAGDGGSRCPMFECTYEGDKQIPEDFSCDESSKCIAYEPELTIICPKHDVEYYHTEWCELCYPSGED